ncbi:hypothetical protein T03_2205 [Trichinella britovi]|uniref:Uncharacterized protein n=1 Tax=Trichinella britovi TaxID=45882 RepID=A0A0V1AIQ1_TRIBR|nr:hypothetical protein T03_2205 [Trichinella britovi]
MFRDELELRQCYRPECMVSPMANNCALGKNRHQAHLNIPTLGLMRRAH